MINGITHAIKSTPLNDLDSYSTLCPASSSFLGGTRKITRKPSQSLGAAGLFLNSTHLIKE
jgi:hypothetical protein